MHWMSGFIQDHKASLLGTAILLGAFPCVDVGMLFRRRAKSLSSDKTSSEESKKWNASSHGG
jgi:hypothetical protein